MSKVILNNVRLSFPDLWTPRPPGPGMVGPPKYGAQFLFAPGSEAAIAAQAAFLEAAKEKWPNNTMNIINMIESSKRCIRRGEMQLTKDGSVRSGYEGMLYILARNQLAPVVVDKNPKINLTQSDGRPYSGCYVNASIDIWAMEKMGQGKSINATLLTVQFRADGEGFSGGMRGSADDFDNIEDEVVGINAGDDASDLF